MTFTDPQNVTHPVELVRRADAPRFYVVRSRLTSQVFHVDAAAIRVNGDPATREWLDEQLNPRRS